MFEAYTCVVSAFRRIVTVRLKPDTTYEIAILLRPDTNAKDAKADG